MLFRLIFGFVLISFGVVSQNLAPDKNTFLTNQSYLFQGNSNYFQQLNQDSIKKLNKPVRESNLANTPSATYSNSIHFLGSHTKSIGNPNQINVAPCVNEGFESTPVGTYTAGNAVAGWSVTSAIANGCANTVWNSGSIEFAILNTPILGFPGIGTVGNSPLGGNKVARLNDYSPSTRMTRLSTTFSVTAANALFQYAFAGYFEKAFVSCCDKPRFQIQVLDCFSNTITCQSFSIVSSLGTCVNPSNLPFSGGNNLGDWINWQVRTMDLSPYIGTCITLNVICMDETYGGRYASILFDANCSTPTTGGVSYCATSSLATIAAPQGYASYTWLSPSSGPTLSAAQATQAVLSLTNPISASVYTVIGVSALGCTVPTTYTINPTQVNLLSLNTIGSCPMGSNGSATVYLTGSSVGYTYNWINASNSVVSTSSVLTSALVGSYTVTINAANNSLCGSVVSALSIGTAQAPPSLVNVPYCTNAYLNAPSGSGYQWYNTSLPISGSTGTMQSLTVSNPTNNSNYRLGYYNLGCRDSIIYTLKLSNPGILLASGSSFSCSGTTSGSMSVNYTPVPNNPYQVPITYSVLSTSGFNPAYNYFLSTNANSFTNAGMYAGYTYSVQAFDGLCLSSYSFNIWPITPLFNFSVGLSNSIICSGNSYIANINFNVNVNPQQYNYLWTPATFMSPGGNTLQTTVLSTSTAPGTTSSVIYTVVVTPTIANCPVTQTLELITANPLTPTVWPVPVSCENDPSFVLQVSPPGGYYINPNLFGIITPSLYPPGVHSNTYAVTLNSCVASSSFTFNILQKPNFVVSPNSTVCAGTTLTLTASGTGNFFWSTLQSGSVIVVSPSISTTYSVMGTHSLNTCQTEKTILVNTFPLPNVQALGNLTVCAGETATLIGTGASTYTWMPNGLINPLIVTPSSTMVFTLQGSSFPDGCVGSTLVKLQVNPCVGMEENVGSNPSILVYPNPGNAIFFIALEEEMTITITNSIGQIIETRHCTAGQHSIDLSAFSDGIYPVICQTAEGSVVIKLLKLN